MSESLQKTLYVKLQELIAFQSEGEWDDATVNADARDFTAELMPIFAALEAERDALRKDRERYQWLANRVLGCDYGDNDAPGQQNGWRIVHDLLAHNGRQPAFMYGTSIDAAIDAAIAAKGAQS